VPVHDTHALGGGLPDMVVRISTPMGQIPALVEVKTSDGRLKPSEPVKVATPRATAVRAVCDFLIANMSAAKLVSVGKATAELASMLWGHYPQEDVRALSWQWRPILACDPRTQSVASECALAQSCAGDDSAGAADGFR
jgi:hypothetical protein